MRSVRSTLLLCGLLAAGCAHKQNPSSKTGVDGSSGSNGSSSTTTANNGNGSGGDSGKQPECGSVRVHFDLDSSEIRATDRPLLEDTAKCLKEKKGLHVTIEGNADERGTEEYNVALGDRRAQSVARFLEKLGANKEQLQTVSYGKDNPLCKEHDEACWEKNRRAQVKGK